MQLLRLSKGDFMNELEQALYERIMRFSFDTGNEPLTFEKRLRFENDWSPDYCARVIEEYKRFVFLAIVAGHPVTPSDQVDQVWHLHLTYTEPYWDNFCPQVLGKALHHVPTRGGPQEAEKFRRWYENTLDSYYRFFGQRPPEDIWPDASVRFGEDLYFRRVNIKRHWIMPRQQLTRLLRNTASGIFLFFLFLGFPLMLVNGDWQSSSSWEVEFSSKNALGIGVVISSFLSKISDHQGFSLAVGIMLIAGLMGFIEHYNWLRCPRCKQSQALKKTEATESDDASLREREEWECRFCGYQLWRNKSSDGGGGGDGGDGGDGGGCGGCGGCGG